MSREIEYAAVSAAKFEEVEEFSCQNNADGGNDKLQSCTVVSPRGGSASIRIQPMERRGRHQHTTPRWSDSNFHVDLRLPEGITESTSMIVTWEAMAREGVALALSPKPGFSMGHTYEVYFGDGGNLVTTLQRKTSAKERVHVSVPSRVCQERAWTTYWVCLSANKLYAGVGNLPGGQCIAILEDTAGQDDKNSNGDDKQETDKVSYVGFGNTGISDRQPASPLKVRNVCVTTVSDHLATKLATLRADQLPLIQLGTDDQEVDAETKALLEEYQQECSKARVRAAKFGVPYQEPAPDAFLPWSQARRLKANPKQGFITGLDLSDPTEKAKQEARRQRFAAVAAVVPEDTAGAEDSKKYDDQEMTERALDIEQAWDNEAFVREQRMDPPSTLWANPLDDTTEESKDVFAMAEPEKPTFAPEKIHVFSIDWAAFKQIRNNDLMAYFSIYSPTYIEWMSDLSANVLFADEFSAKRALEAMSQELISPPPETVTALTAGESPPDLGNMGWRFCKKPIHKIKNDRYGRRGTTARLLMRVATSRDILKERPSSWPKPPPGFSTKRILGPGSDFAPRGGDFQQKRRRSDRDNVDRASSAPQDVESLLSGGLRAGRSGFSVEELEAERAQKRAKTEQTEDASSEAKAD